MMINPSAKCCLFIYEDIEKKLSKKQVKTLAKPEQNPTSFLSMNTNSFATLIATKSLMKKYTRVKKGF